MRRARIAASVAAIVACCSTALPAASAGDLKADPPRRFASCGALRDARRLDIPLHRPGIAARRCAIAPGAWFAVLSDDSASWPVVRDGPRAPAVSLEDPVARRQWFADASPLRVSTARNDALVVLRDARRAPQSAYYSAAADRADAPGRIPAFVAVRIRPRPCILGVVRDAGEARRLAADEASACVPPVEPR
ncbi:MAG: hypothetical protein ICV73_19265 [Acetobacteraceae bacterium]|nr:hypothetical protein [Acetobacteraceae bacterium]